MKITRCAAPDMRQALRIVREQLGINAVILSQRRTANGVEVTAAVDFDTEALEHAGETRTIPPLPTQSSPAATTIVEPVQFAPPAAPTAPTAPTASTAAPVPATQLAGLPGGFDPTTSIAVTTMETELKTLRRMLETQLAQLAWNDLSRRAPIHTAMLRELTEVGLSRDLATAVVGSIPAAANLTQARRLGIASLAQRVLVTGDRWLQEGGRIALIGPTGVGKSSTLAKLAVRWVLNHGARDLAIVAADTQRLAGQAQTQSLAQLLGAHVYSLENFAELPSVVAQLARFRLVLIDTPGSSQRDAQLAGRLAVLASVGRDLESALVLAASTQAGAVAEVVTRFAPANPTSCVLTKLDEATSLGGALSVLIGARLPLSYVSEGQRVPEDLRPARALELVTSAVQLAELTGAAADEDLLKHRFGEVAHGLA